MRRRGRYGRYLHAVESFVGLLVVNLSYLIATIIDENVIGFRWKVAWLLVNVCYLPVIYMRGRQSRSRAIHADVVIGNSIEAVGVHALFFFASLIFLASWIHNMSFYLWFYGILLLALPIAWISTRMATKRFRRHGGNYASIVIVGAGPTAKRLCDEMMTDPGYGYRFMGYFDNTPPEDENMRYCGTIDDLGQYLLTHNIDEVYYTLSAEDSAILQQVITAADNAVAQFFYVPPVSPYLTRIEELHNIGIVPIMSIRRQPLNKLTNRIIKRGFDIIFSSAFLLVSPLIFIPVAIGIKMTSPGPVFFKQKRTGYLGRDFYCWKFRTMHVNRDADARQATRNDNRVTKFGHFLRHTSIDELPQFINVWLGDMSVVGPRPHMLKHTDDYRKIIKRYMVRHFIKPGITGWAQIKGFRGQTEEVWQMEKRVENDVWYIEHWSFLLDIKIVFLTIINVFKGEDNAY